MQLSLVEKGNFLCVGCSLHNMRFGVCSRCYALIRPPLLALPSSDTVVKKKFPVSLLATVQRFAFSHVTCEFVHVCSCLTIKLFLTL